MFSVGLKAMMRCNWIHLKRWVEPGLRAAVAAPVGPVGPPEAFTLASGLKSGMLFFLGPDRMMALLDVSGLYFL